MLTPPDQAWYWTPEWQAGEAAADADLAAGRGTVYRSGEEFLAAFDAIPAADEPRPEVTRMPWWGWLIAGSVGFLGLALVVTVAIIVHAIRTIDDADERPGWPNRPDGWR